MQAGQPDMLLGQPLYTSAGMATAASAAIVGAFGDFKKYIIADRGGRTINVLNELYAANDQVGIKYTQRVDGKLTQAAAIKTLKMAT